MGKKTFGYLMMVAPAVHSILKATVPPVTLAGGYGTGSFIGGWIGSVVGVLFGLAITLSASSEE